MVGLILSVLLTTTQVSVSLVREVRAAVQKNDFAGAERLIEKREIAEGATPEVIEAWSWLGRGALAAKQFDKAETYAAQTRKMALEALKTRKLDDERRLPIALGASIEVQGHVMAERGERDQAVAFLRSELERWRGTSIRTRIQKNINLLSLEGKPAPAIAASGWIGDRATIAGRPVLVFLWAHWCGDCKGMAGDLARIEREFGPRGLVLIAPTQRYGYVQRGEEAGPEAELKYIGEVLKQHYSGIRHMPVPVSEETFRNYGASTTPTIVLIDARGIVRLYHPGEMTYGELAPRIEQLLRPMAKGVAAGR